MKGESIRVCDLAKELGVSRLELVNEARRLNIKAVRGVALLNGGQAHRLRESFEGRRRRIALQRSEAFVSPTTTTPDERQEVEEEQSREASCVCCSFTFLYKPNLQSSEVCSECSGHFQQNGETPERTLGRADDHVRQARGMVNKYREAAVKQATERAAAYEKRNRWMAALVEIVVAHAPDEEARGCVCGSPEFPCVTRRHLQSVNKGIYKRCEELELLDESERDKVLYGGDYSFFREWDDARGR